MISVARVENAESSGPKIPNISLKMNIWCYGDTKISVMG